MDNRKRTERVLMGEAGFTLVGGQKIHAKTGPFILFFPQKWKISVDI